MKTLCILSILLAACGGTVDHSTSAPLAQAAASCDGTCTTDADCGLGLGCATDGMCGIVCSNGNTICPTTTLCTASGDCLKPCQFANATVFYLDSVPAGYCPAPFTERETGRCFLSCGDSACTTYGGVNACDGSSLRSKAKPRRVTAR